MQHSIVFFDGVCNLCNRSVRFIIKRDRKDLFRFAPLQAELAEHYLKDTNGQRLSAMVLLENGKLYYRSTAALKIAKQLKGLWPLLYGFIIIPAFIRDYFYRLISRNRYKIWGKTGYCEVASPALKHKFLQTIDDPASLAHS